MVNFVAHFGIQADDLDRARAFYGDVFGWRFEPWGPADYFKVYTGEASGVGVTEGGLGRRPTPDGSGTVEPAAAPLFAYRCSISVASIETAVEAIEAHGGRMLSPIVELPGVGKVAQFEDPERNVVAVVEYVATDPRAATPAGGV